MKQLLVAALLVSGMSLICGCGPSEPSEAQLHQMLAKPPVRPHSQGVGMKRLEQKGAVPPPSGGGQ